jgi:hypothetical protein
MFVLRISQSPLRETLYKNKTAFYDEFENKKRVQIKEPRTL